ncbi:MAG: hypothetical protein FJ102_02430, partial [Deltaproteobacteria bacterium]|nr:hypothetical protein [Deltaproteobacteria bacterium]
MFVVSGTTPSPLADQVALEATDAYSFLGSGLDGGSDANGDGYPDLLLGLTGIDDGRGLALLVEGQRLAATGGLATDLASGGVEGSEAQSYLGSHAEFVGDPDGDGQVEVAISAPYATSTGHSHAGAVYLYPAAELARGVIQDLASAAATWTGAEAGLLVGNNVHAVGDQDGDGLVDVAVSNGTSALWVIGELSSGTVDDLALTKIIDAIADTRMLGDVDGDGRADLLVLGPEAAIFADLTAVPTWSREAAYATFATEGDALTEAIDLGDRDG